jgi:hypothetical protein
MRIGDGYWYGYRAIWSDWSRYLYWHRICCR